MAVTLLGPQRRPTVDAVVRALDPAGPVATVTAGWQEREDDDAELAGLLGGRQVERLRLHARWLDVQERDPEFAVAEREHAAVLDELRQLYLLQLDSAMRAVYGIAERGGDRPRARSAALADAEGVVRLVDGNHLARVRAAHASFSSAWRPHERPVVAGHREQVHAALRSSGAVVVAGGHVGVLLRVLHLFHVAPSLPDSVIAWSAGAMALTQRIVLFHDHGTQGPSHAEVYDEGLGVVRAVLLPHARRRLRVEDPMRMAVFARRFAPAPCVVLDDGVRVDLVDGAAPPGARRIGADGRIAAGTVAA